MEKQNVLVRLKNSFKIVEDLLSQVLNMDRLKQSKLNSESFREEQPQPEEPSKPEKKEDLNEYSIKEIQRDLELEYEDIEFYDPELEKDIDDDELEQDAEEDSEEEEDEETVNSLDKRMSSTMLADFLYKGLNIKPEDDIYEDEDDSEE